MTEPINNLDLDFELEIIELEDKIAPRNWNVYALMASSSIDSQ